ncbi:MAG: hypothetical protein KA100_00225 [Rickettsiales bacterium]|nr:hypothetical protein [Rickettsiales bacterium]
MRRNRSGTIDATAELRGDLAAEKVFQIAAQVAIEPELLFLEDIQLDTDAATHKRVRELKAGDDAVPSARQMTKKNGSFLASPLTLKAESQNNLTQRN